MKYTHRFTVTAPLAAVADFHAQAASMAAITPPPVVAQVHHAPAHLQSGDTIDFTLWLGPLPVRWLARIEDVSPAGFVDRQVRGPFKVWVHRHRFVSLAAAQTEVIDEIELEFRRHPLWALVGLGMRLNLPLLFAYRGWKTRRLLEKRQPDPSI